MATPAEILVVQKDGTVMQSALLYDGYPSFVVPYLLTKYKKVEDAMMLGSVGDFTDISDPVGSKVKEDGGGRGPQRLAKLPKNKAIFAEYAYVFRNRKWYVMMDIGVMMPVSAPERT